MRRRRARPEDQIQRAVFEHLRVRAAPGVFAFHPFNGGYRRPVEAAIAKSLGVRAGVPDVIAIKRGQCYALELKAEKGRVRDTQNGVQAELSAAGATVGTAWGLDNALNWLETHGLLVGRAA